MKTIGKGLGFLALALAALALPARAHADEDGVLKIATLAPRGSAWAKIMEQGGRDVEKATAGRVQVKYFFSGQAGDERDVVRKMKLGQLDGAAITAVGLGLIRGDVRVLELPFLFKNDKELDFVRAKMAADFEKQFDEAGYVLLSWGDIGWIHLYSNIEIKGREDLAKTKMWAWTDDPIVRAFFKRMGVNGVPLGVPDVLPSLQTGLIDACYGSPLAAVALQWYTKVKFATALPISYSIGAYVVRKEKFEKLSKEDQQAMRDAGKTMGDGLLKTVRKDNDRARKAMEKQGVSFMAVPPAMATDLESQAEGVWGELSGKLYPPELLAKVKGYLAEARK